MKDLKYYINLVDKVVTGFDRTDSNFEKCLRIGKMLSNNIVYYRVIMGKRKSQSIMGKRKSQSNSQTSLWSYFKKLP